MMQSRRRLTFDGGKMIEKTIRIWINEEPVDPQLGDLKLFHLKEFPGSPELFEMWRFSNLCGATTQPVWKLRGNCSKDELYDRYGIALEGK